MAARIGSYEVLGLIGDGGMGTVYRARDPRFDRQVAIKVLHAHFRRDPGIVDRFKSEAVIEAKLNHPHIVTVLDFIADKTTLAMVMEYVEGQPLSAVIEAARGSLAVERTVCIMDQVLSVMAYAHERGLVHRDLKPSNVLLQRLGSQEYAKVMDFGIAKILSSEKLQTATGAKMGTLAYMSPEHVRSPKRVDARSDIYSPGVVLYEMLTGCLPFDAESEYELMQQIVTRPARLVSELAPAVGPGLSAAVARSLAKDPSQRFRTCEEMRLALGGRGRTPEAPAVSIAVAAPGAGAGALRYGTPAAAPPVATRPPAPASERARSVPVAALAPAPEGAAQLNSVRVGVASACLYGIAGATLASRIMALTGSDWYLTLGFLLVEARAGQDAATFDLGSVLLTAAAVTLAIVTGVWGRQGRGWAFLAGAASNALDGIGVALTAGVSPGLLLRLVVLVFILRGYQACRNPRAASSFAETD
jgi:serine/threonine-protein kinase